MNRVQKFVWFFVGVLFGTSVVGLGALNRIGSAYYHGQLTVLNQCAKTGVAMVGNYIASCDVHTLDEYDRREEAKKNAEVL